MPPQKQYECRFCLQTDEKQNLLAPCMCKGTYKYVHNACLLQWYIQSPTRGDRCNVCSYIYKQDKQSALEGWESTSLFVALHLFHPFPMILFSHWFYFTILSYVRIQSSDLLYTIYQLLFHAAMSFEFLYAVYRVQNRHAYAIEWRRLPRPLLPMIHSYLLLILPTTGVLGGIAANMCMVYYFYEHRYILRYLNENRRLQFLSRHRQP